MKEDIEIIEEKIKIIESLCTDDCINKSTVIDPLKYALENLLTRYKEMEIRNDELNKAIGKEYELGKAQAEYEVNEEWKYNIQEKIEEYKKVIEITEKQLKHEENVDVRRRHTTTIEQATAGILALEGLLREE